MSKVNYEGFCGGGRVQGADLLDEGVEFGGCAGDEKKGVLGAGKLEREFFADTIRGTGYDDPGLWGAKRGELVAR